MSRPQSTAFTYFHSSLPYALVRDFAYPPFHPMHYGPPPEQPSGISTPISEAHHRRLSDPPPTWDGSRGQWSAGPWEPGDHLLPKTSFADPKTEDGPPWAEDEDIASPVVTSSRHRKARSEQPSRSLFEIGAPRRGSYTGTNGDGSETYYVSEANELANGPGGEFITYPPSSATSTGGGNNGALTLETTAERLRRNSHFAGGMSPGMLRKRNAIEDNTHMLRPSPTGFDADDDRIETDESRFSRDYQFTIASPDEEMHGRAVAMYDFAREHENELPLVEGQVILVSYRHGQGWLVAQDPKTGESGLVPEEYVRLLRDIGGWNGLITNGTPSTIATSTGATAENQSPQHHVGDTSPTSGGGDSAKTPTQESQPTFSPHSTTSTGNANSNANSKEWYPPVVSTFSTCREDFEPWPHHLLGSQANTPTHAGQFERRGSEDTRGKKKAEGQTEEGRREED